MRFPLVRTVAALALVVGLVSQVAAAAPSDPATATPIQHLVVIFQENVSFDHYFGAYPNAANPAGEPGFAAAPGTPSVNGLSQDLLAHNPNTANPRRLSRSEALTCDMDHGYEAEQQAFDHGLMDQFIQHTSGSSCADKNLVMDYYDGNTTTAMWNYAQHFAMSDNSFGTTFGPSTPGALNLVAGQTHGATPADLPKVVANGTIFSDTDPTDDACSSTKNPTVAMSGRNVGDLMNDNGVTWGWFQGGFKPTAVAGNSVTCGAAHQNIGGNKVTDYSPHHEPFQYYKSTANPNHLPPTSVAMVGKTDQANHQYDLTDFWAAADAGNLPAVSYLKAAEYQDGHAGYSDPLDEQQFLAETINHLQTLPSWANTAVVIAYDDSDGWYDHVMGPIVNVSADPANDALTDPGMCGAMTPGAYPDRCGYGPRLPLLVISPYARVNFVDHTITDQSAILRFVEENWGLGRIGDQSFDEKAGSLNGMFDFSHAGASVLTLDPATGMATSGRSSSDVIGRLGG